MQRKRTGGLALALAGLLILASGAPNAAQDLATAPVAAQRLEVWDTRPQVIEVAPGGRTVATIAGRGLDRASGVVALARRGPAAGIQIGLRCAGGDSCRLVVSAGRTTATGAYQLVLVDAGGAAVARIPAELTVRRTATLPDGREPRPQATHVQTGEPGVIVQHSCGAGPYPIDVALASPEEGAGIVAGTTLTWQRAEHEICGLGSDKRYALAICGSLQGPCLPSNGLYQNVVIDPNVIGPGAFTLTAENIQLIAANAGVAPGATVYWQMRYQYGSTYGPWTAKRALLFDSAPVEPDPPPPPDDCVGCPAPPELHLPLADARIDAVNRNFYWSPAGADSWELCLRPAGAQDCAVTLPRPFSDAVGLGFEDFAEWGLTGRAIDWRVRGCNAAGCGGWAERRAYVPLPPAERVYPAHEARLAAPRSLIWRRVDGADFYRVNVSWGHPGGAASPPPRFWISFADVPQAPADTRQLSATLSQALLAQIEVPYLDRVARWDVLPCYDRPSGAPVCADALFAPWDLVASQVLTITAGAPDHGQVSFDALLDTFRSPSCVACHAVSVSGLPSGHPAAATGTCTTCHASGLLPQGTHIIPWQAAPAGMDFRLPDGQIKAPAALCAMGQDKGNIATDVADHLAGDPLILWAVTGGPLPLNQGNGARAFAGTLDEWKALAQAWFDAAMPCDKPEW